MILNFEFNTLRHRTENWRTPGAKRRRPPFGEIEGGRRGHPCIAVPGIADAAPAEPDPAAQPAGDGNLSLGANLVESLHLLLTIVAETSQTGDSGDRALLDELTSDRSEMMDGIRKQLLGEAAAAPVREALLVATMLFERAVWLVRELRLGAAPVALEPAA